ncbi:MAG: hypothetical protein PHG71_03310 [Kiritimatiellae bacterium]|nr:hypothetical protein [Kiritimatiellia bacterium]
MKALLCRVGLLIVIALCRWSAVAATPQAVTYQGRLVEAAGPVNGARALVFEIYTAESGGARLYCETNTPVCNDGLFSTALGTRQPTEFVAALAGGRLVAGAPYDDQGGPDSGVAHVFRLDGSLVDTITNPTPASGDNFGKAVAAVGGDCFVVGAPADNSGAVAAGLVHLYDAQGVHLADVSNPTPEAGDRFGAALSGVGSSMFIVGAPSDDTEMTDLGAAHLFWNDGRFIRTISNVSLNANESFGSAVAAQGANGFVIGAKNAMWGGQYESGVAWQFRLSTAMPGLMVAAENLNAGVVTATALAAGSVGSAAIAAGSVSNLHLAAGSITADRLVDGVGSGLDADFLDGQDAAYYRDAGNLNAGTLGTGRFSAYTDLAEEGKLDNNADADLLTRLQADGRFSASSHLHSIYLLKAGDTMSGDLVNTGSLTANRYYNSNNPVAASHAAALGGTANTLSSGADYGVIGGGTLNSVASASTHVTVVGGYDNDVGTNTNYSTVGGGRNNDIADNGFTATISGGNYNYIGVGSWCASILGGYCASIGTNVTCATIAGGSFNSIGHNANYAFAAGRNAKANHPGAFVWADSGATDFISAYDNQFAVRASGGLYVQSSRGVALNNYVGPLITRGGNDFTSNAASKYQGHGRWGAFKETGRLVLGIPDSGGAYYCEVAKYATNGTRTALMTVDQSGNVGATAFNPSSDRNVKQGFAPVDTKAVMESLSTVPIQTWSFKSDPDTCHIGPMAQDFYAAFNVGSDERHIATVDADGVALAAIQELYRMVREQQAELQEKDRQIEELMIRIERLENH